MLLMIWGILIILSTLFLAFANGANDNFKGVATLFGSKTAGYRKALLWATLTTFAGSVAAFFLAAKLIQTFSGKGLVPDSFLAAPAFLAAVIVGAGLTVFVAAKMGIPISTTHSLTGALAGTGLVAVGGGLGFATLGKSFFIPLFVSPLIAVTLAVLIYPAFRFVRKACGVTKNTCVCVGEKVVQLGDCFGPAGLAMTSLRGGEAISKLRFLEVMMDEKTACETQSIEIYGGRLFGIAAQKIVDVLHFLSAGLVSFARGLNDTPKIVALSLATGMIGAKGSITLVALAIAFGGVLSARKVAETMSQRITGMNHGQGFTANFITALLVIFASGWGVPVSTTHVSCGSLFGIGLVNGKANWKVISGILSAWLLTLPMAGILSSGCFLLLKRMGAV